MRFIVNPESSYENLNILFFKLNQLESGIWSSMVLRGKESYQLRFRIARLNDDVLFLFSGLSEIRVCGVRKSRAGEEPFGIYFLTSTVGISKVLTGM